MDKDKSLLNVMEMLSKKIKLDITGIPRKVSEGSYVVAWRKQCRNLKKIHIYKFSAGSLSNSTVQRESVNGH